MCKTGRQFRAAVAGAVAGSGLSPGVSVEEGETLELRRVVERYDGTAVEGEWYGYHYSSF